MLTRRVAKIVADEITFASEVGATIRGEQIAVMHNLDPKDVADTIRYFLAGGGIRLTKTTL